MTDPFAAAQVTGARISTQSTAPVDNPFNGVDMDASNPFASPDDVRVNFKPAPKLEDLSGRLVVMIPRLFRSDHPKNEQYVKPGESPLQDLYTVDLHVIEQRALTFVTIEKGKDGALDIEKKTDMPAVEFPADFPGVWILQAAIIGQLRRVDGSARPLLAGRVRRGPTKNSRARTFDAMEAEWAAYEDKLRSGNFNAVKPQFSWQIDVALNADDQRLLMGWWNANKDVIGQVGKSRDVTGQR